MYGNIGARDRLDFTVISASVNEACRLEALCKPLATPLTLSEAFVRAAGAEHVVDLGFHELKGVGRAVRVYSLERFKAAQLTSRTSSPRERTGTASFLGDGLQALRVVRRLSRRR